ncbi:hypothetical protein MANES_12G100200v8 [Manihot esculenta]|uniref:Uncharacterized protein n=1 Tax=Manihot esculenta TaxID=3983 RepID=A0A2C9UUW3_MANES|nr:hypothetical protein MANES_12G100200v8 [Manihot esculenta]
MANVVFTCFFFSLVIFSYIVCVEGRNLKCVECFNASPDDFKSLTRNPSRGNTDASSSHDGSQDVIEPSDGYIDAFRPTNPGHSPGVGH